MKEHVLTTQWFNDINHLHGIILMNINNTQNIISNSNTWGSIYNKLIREFLRITPHTEDYLDVDLIAEQTLIGYNLPSMTRDYACYHTIYSVLGLHNKPPLLIQ